MRARNIRVAYCGIGDGDATSQKKWDAEIEAYKSAVRQGVEPAGTKMPQIREAMELSDKVGRPFDAGTGLFR